MQDFLQKMLRMLKKFLLIVILLGAGVLAFFYWVPFESGIWAGKVISVTKRGVIFKTFEGKISMESYGALKGVSPIAETRDFSIESSNPEIIKLLEEVALSGERVNLHYVKLYLAFPWRGDTRYFIESVERSSITPTPPQPPQ